ncbi:MAG: AzlC family ABC transporter permease [Sulfobacillus thermotolerans]|uniref:Branched-chain amino acid ABC transporter permease n=1 Tax=Sulfobacillus thermotolerans TaxID=338644 RepID=A0ABN5H053_9FIRM|nr:hypothetical protein BXT84_08375 [Sulfobacillus thermotolerans]MCY0907666.1 AzlC family ABC transporter permease [Sulfobacillus thermotolerans]
MKTLDRRQSTSQALPEGLAIVLGYLPASMAFGMAARHFGIPTWGILAMSAFIYAGTSQFALAGLWAGHAPLWLDVGTVWLINMRHAVYGPALTMRQSLARKIFPLLTGWGLTDEVFAALVRYKQASLAHYGQVTAMAYSAWLTGTMAGVLFGTVILRQVPSASEALAFVLPALFIAILWHWITPLPGQWDRMAIAVVVLTSVFYGGMRISQMGSLAVPLAAGSAASVVTVYGSWKSKQGEES